MNTTHTMSLAAGVALATVLGIGCASSEASKELRDARAAYLDAKQSEAANWRPDELVDAKQALDAAEAAHREDPAGSEERHLAYMAERRAEIAKARGQTYALQKSSEDKQGQLAAKAKDYAVQAHGRLSDAERQLATERDYRRRAETMAQDAIADLKRVAMVKEERRGLVITLSGAVLFSTGKSELLSTAKDKLQQVARALADQEGDSRIVVEGYTDSRGSSDYNARLSTERANTVKDYLEQQGVPAQRLEARGLGEANPIADNSTAEGRANNRRVEIVVEGNEPSGTASTTVQSGPDGSTARR